MHSAAYIAAIGAIVATVKADSGSGEPGYCKDDTSCEDNYVCISVQTTRSGIEDVKQCLPYTAEGDVCSGTFSGLCPSFSTWNTAFQSISSVCAYQVPSGTDQCLNDTVSAGSDTAGYVSCVSITEGSGSSAESLGVIYGCVDFDGTNLLFLEDSDNWALSSQMNYSAVINEGCVNPSNGENSDVVCSGRGTCAPSSSGGMDYACQCNVGYNGTYCQRIVSNKCTLESQCQAGTCNLATQECECDEGTTGNQCAYCDPSSSKACNGHGTCVAVTSTSNSTVSNSTASNSTAPNSTAPNSTAPNSTASSLVASNLVASGSRNADLVSDVSSGDLSSRFLMEMMDMASSSGSGNANVCECESGYTGDQCTREVESNSSDNRENGRRSSPSSDAVSVATSIVLVASVVLVAFLN